MMKRNSLMIAILCLSSALLLWSCKKEDSTGSGSGSGSGVVVEQDVNNIYNGELVLPANAIVGFNFLPAGPLPTELFNVPFPTNTEAELVAAGHTTDKILRIEGKSMSMTVKNPASGNFDFMDNIEVFVEDVDGNNRTLYAHKRNYGLGFKTLNMDMTGLDVKEIFRADTAIIVFEGSKRSATSNIQAGTEIDFATTVVTTVNANKN